MSMGLWGRLEELVSTAKIDFQDLVERYKIGEHKYLLSKALGDDGKPHHIPNIKAANLDSNTIFFLPGSPGRAKKIAKGEYLGEERVDEVTDEIRKTFLDIQEIKDEDRGFTIYYGHVLAEDGETHIPVATMATQMGAPNVDIVVKELYASGIRNMIRVGTSGVLANKNKYGKSVKAGDIIIAEAATMDVLSGLFNFICPWLYTPKPDKTLLNATLDASKKVDAKIYEGKTYSKNFLYANEFYIGTWLMKGYNYVTRMLKSFTGHVNSEMEAAQLYLEGDRINKTCKLSEEEKIRTCAYCLVIGERREENGRIVEYGFVPEAKKEGMPKLQDLTIKVAQEVYKADHS